MTLKEIYEALIEYQGEAVKKDFEPSIEDLYFIEKIKEAVDGISNLI